MLNKDSKWKKLRGSLRSEQDRQFDKREELIRLIIKTASAFPSSPSREFLSYIFDLLVGLSLRDSWRVLDRVSSDYDRFPSYFEIKAIRDEIQKENKKVETPEVHANWVSKQAPGISAVAEAAFQCLLENPNDETRKLKLMNSRQMSLREFDEAFDMWRTGKVHPKVRIK